MNVAALPQTALTDKHERFVAEIIDGATTVAAYATVYPESSKIAIAANASRLRARTDVAARIAQLQSAIAERTVISAQRQLLDLAEMATADISEVWRLEHRPCDACHQLYDKDMMAGRAMPDLSQPLPPHPACGDARAHQHVVMLPLDQWPAATRRLYDGVQMMRDGTLQPVFRDRSQLADMVNKLLGSYVVKTESKSLNINYHITPAASQPPLSADDAIRRLREMGVLTDPNAVVSEQ